MISVKATREGLLGGRTASGYVIEETVPFVALPSLAALRLWVRLFNPATGRACRAVVLDVGPWNTRDHAYVFGNGAVRPQAESGTDLTGRPTNRAGIDLSERVWTELGMTENGLVWWEFL